MSTRVALMANDLPGLEICRYLVADGDDIVRLYIHEEERQKHSREIVRESGCKEDEIFGASSLKDPRHVETLKDLAPDFIVTVYWAHILSQDVINCARRGTVNFHPALLPINRGWYPHVHSIIDGSPAGVTLHAIDAGVDSGPVWVQKEIEISPVDTSLTIYVRLQNEIVHLFKENWGRITSGELNTTPQDETKAVYHMKSEIGALDRLDPESIVKVDDLINRLRARSFGDKGFAYIKKGGRKIYLNLRLSESSSFE